MVIYFKVIKATQTKRHSVRISLDRIIVSRHCGSSSMEHTQLYYNNWSKRECTGMMVWEVVHFVRPWSNCTSYYEGVSTFEAEFTRSTSTLSKTRPGDTITV